MIEPFVGQIALVGFDFAPQGWALCNGQLLPISQNTALFSLLGTRYGGNGRVTFGLPDLQGRAPIHAGAGPKLSERDQGEDLGSESVTLLPWDLPPHSHGLQVATEQTTDRPTGNVVPAPRGVYGTPIGIGRSTGIEGSGEPFSNMQPSLAMNYVIALQGIYPGRD